MSCSLQHSLARQSARLELAQRHRLLVFDGARHSHTHGSGDVLSLGQRSSLHAYRQRTTTACRSSRGPYSSSSRARAANEASRACPAPVASFDVLLARAQQQVPGWVMITVALAAAGDGPVTASIQGPDAFHPFQRSQLTLNRATGDVVKWEPYANNSTGRKLRTWVRALHTGEAFGFTGQTVAGLASLGGCFLVWTGLGHGLAPLPLLAPQTRRGMCIHRGIGDHSSDQSNPQSYKPRRRQESRAKEPLMAEMRTRKLQRQPTATPTRSRPRAEPPHAVQRRFGIDSVRHRDRQRGVAGR